MTRFAYPWAFLALMALPVLWYAWRRAAAPVLRFSDLGAVRAAGTTFWTRLRFAPRVLRSIALIALIVAVARPQRADQSTNVTVEGIAVQLIIDTSSSMMSWDLSPPGQNINRLSVAKNVMSRFVRGGEDQETARANDLIGLIRFARFSDCICPFTLDHTALLGVLARVTLVDRAGPEDLTAIGDALALGVERLRSLRRPARGNVAEDYQVKSKIIVLLTDGENNAGMVSPEQAGDIAATYGVKIYSILVGRISSEGRPVDDTVLRKIADVTGGKFFRATDAQLLEKAYAEIDRLERSKIEHREYVDYEELARPYILAGIAALLLQTLLEATRLRRIP